MITIGRRADQHTGRQTSPQVKIESSANNERIHRRDSSSAIPERLLAHRNGGHQEASPRAQIKSSTTFTEPRQTHQQDSSFSFAYRPSPPRAQTEESATFVAATHQQESSSAFLYRFSGHQAASPEAQIENSSTLMAPGSPDSSISLPDHLSIRPSKSAATRNPRPARNTSAYLRS